MSYLVSVLREVKDEDIPALPDDDVRLAAAQIVRSLYSEPRIGDPMRERYNLRILAGCRKVLFDKESWEGKPRFRLVFRNEPGDEAVDRVTVLSIGPRADLAAYKQAAGRLGAQRRAKRATPRPE